MLRINKCIFIAYIITAFTPIAGNTYIQFGLMVLWILTALMIRPKLQRDYKLVILIWLMYAVGLKIIGYSTASIGNYGIQMMFFFPLFVYEFYKREVPTDDLRKLMYFGLFVLTINMLYNLIFLILNPGANIELNFSDTYAGMNLGNSEFTFVVMLMLIIFLYYSINGKPTLLPIVIIGIIYLVVSSKTTSFLLFVVIGSCVVIDRFTKNINKTQKVILLSIVVILALFLYRFGLTVLTSFIKNEYLLARINALIAGDSTSTYLSRIELAKLSFNTFLKNPFIGIGFVKADFAKVSYISTGVGHHSEFIDHLARYGLVGAVFYICIFGQFIKKTIQNAASLEGAKVAKYVIIGFFASSVLNNSIFTISGVMLFFIVSGVADGLFMNKNETNKTWEIYSGD